MPNQLPKGFGATLKKLYARGYDRKQAFKEAWRIHRPYKKTVREAGKLLRRPLNPRKKTRYCLSCGGKMPKAGPCLTCAVPPMGSRKNPKTISLQFFGKRKKFIVDDKGEIFEQGHKRPMSESKLKDLIRKEISKQNPIAIYNPVKGAKLLYGKARIPKVYGMKTEGRFKGQKFVHTSSHDVSIFGLPNGDLLIKGQGRRLWANDADVEKYEK